MIDIWAPYIRDIRWMRLYMCIQKILSSIHTKEHIEMDCFFSEFDMPVRWGLLRLKEMDVLNVVIYRTLADIMCIHCVRILLYIYTVHAVGAKLV